MPQQRSSGPAAQQANPATMCSPIATPFRQGQYESYDQLQNPAAGNAGSLTARCSAHGSKLPASCSTHDTAGPWLLRHTASYHGSCSHSKWTAAAEQTTGCGAPPLPTAAWEGVEGAQGVPHMQALPCPAAPSSCTPNPHTLC